MLKSIKCKFVEINVRVNRSDIVTKYQCPSCLRTKVVTSREYNATGFRFKLKPDTKRSFIIPASLEKLGGRLRSTDNGKLEYEYVVPLHYTQAVINAFGEDPDIGDWETFEDTNCDDL